MNVHSSEQPHYGILTPDQRVRVFVSSTLEELREERIAARAVVENELMLHPVMFDEGACPHPPRDRYRAMLLQSHIYVGIFWESYGWVAPDMDVSGIEDEYNLSSNKVRLVYIKNPAQRRDIRLAALLERMQHESTFCYAKFSTIEDLAGLIKNDIQHVLSETFLLHGSDRVLTTPSFLSALQVDMRSHPLIERTELVNMIIQRLEETRRLTLVGNPGVGKTYLLGEIGTRLDALYISLKGKTTQQVCAHLANHLALRRGKAPRSLLSEEESRDALQAELALVDTTLLIDHVEQSPATAPVLAGLDPFHCRILFASRPIHADSLSGLAQFGVPPFDQAEISQFLQTRDIHPAPGEFQRLVTASRGNALYLDYFSRHQISPLPQGLSDYQSALWERLSPEHQGIVAFVAHSLDPLRVDDLHVLAHAEGRTSATVGETKRQLELVAPLVCRIESHWEIFHPYFQEYVVSEAAQDGLSDHYHRFWVNTRRRNTASSPPLSTFCAPETLGPTNTSNKPLP